MSYLIRPDHPEGAGYGAQAASGAFLHIKGGDFSLFMESSAKADHGATSLLAVMA
jgi:hypothetical protein